VFIALTGDFHNALNWTPTGVPSSQDRIAIPTGHVCYVLASATVDTANIETGAKVWVQASSSSGNVTLTLVNSANNIGGFPDNSLIDGVLECSGGGGSNAHLYFQGSHTVAGNGSIEMGGGEIVINDSKTLTSDLAQASSGIRGGFTMRSLGLTQVKRAVFRNRGMVAATGDITFESNLDLTDVHGALWGVGCKQEVTFKRNAPFLQGDFFPLHVTRCGGFWRFEAAVATCGSYTRGYGGLYVIHDGAFMYKDFIATPGVPSSCDNPGVNGPGTTDCTDLWEVAQGNYGYCCTCE
jgi:hypothetical protein